MGLLLRKKSTENLTLNLNEEIFLSSAPKILNQIFE